MAHGVGLCDEYPAIYYPKERGRAGYEGRFETNMAVCLESYIGEEGGPDGLRLEEERLVAGHGALSLPSYPLELR